MRLCNNSVLAILVFATAVSLTAQQPHLTQGSGASVVSAVSSIGDTAGELALLTPLAQQNPQTQQTSPSPQTPQSPSLTVDRDPVRSPDAEPPSTEVGPIRKEGPQGYTLHTEVDEVVLNCTVLDGNRLVPDLKKDDFTVFEDPADFSGGP